MRSYRRKYSQRVVQQAIPPPHAVPGPEEQVPQIQTGGDRDDQGGSILNVRDALTYLDQIKKEFADRADVCNLFLDIMKDFKAQIIGTPHVIYRVSQLFAGHNQLIQGFNMFLPPGYRIETMVDPMDPDRILVTTPSGTISQSALRDEYGESVPLPTVRNESQYSAAIPDVPINHAIHFVDEIKARFSHEPEKYKAFLDILQTYQQRARPIAEVFQQVNVLFDGQEDLIAEFQEFLPDNARYGFEALAGEGASQLANINGSGSMTDQIGVSAERKGGEDNMGAAAGTPDGAGPKDAETPTHGHGSPS